MVEKETPTENLTEGTDPVLSNDVNENPTEAEAQDRINQLIAEQAEVEKVRLQAEQKENEERLAVEQEEVLARQEEEEKLREVQDKKLRSLTTQVKNLRDEGVDISSLVDEVTEKVATKTATYERRGAALADQIAAWLTISTGREHDGDDILILDTRPDRVQYRIKGTDVAMGILRKGDQTLVDPPVHDHEYKVLSHGAQSKCGCGKSNPESKS